LRILLDDMTVLYQAGKGHWESENQEKHAELDVASGVFSMPVECDFETFISYREEINKGPRGHQLFTFWQRVLNDPLPILHLPTDHPRPPQRTFASCSLPFSISSEQSHAIREFSRSENFDIETIMCTLFHSLLFRYTSQTESLLGITVPCREESEILQTVGPFSAVVPLRGDFHGNPTFKMVLQRQSSLMHAAAANSSLPMTEVLKVQADRLNSLKNHTPQSEGDTSRNPLVDVAFHWESPFTDNQSLPENIACLLAGVQSKPFFFHGMRMQTCQVNKSWSPFDLQLVMSDSDEQTIYGVFHYNTALFDKITIERMAVHFNTLLQSAITHPNQKISELNMVESNEYNLAVHEWNNTTQNFNLSLCVHQMVEMQVERTPNATAITNFDGISITYNEMNERANQLAHHLRFLGVQPDMPIPIFLERSASVVIALLAVLKSGGTCMPLDPKYPKDRMIYMLKQANASIIITERKLQNRVPDECNNATVIVLEDEQHTLSQCLSTNPSINNRSSRDLAYVIYTSGSTGQPKGVMLEHRSLVNYMTWHVEYYEMIEGDRVLHNAGLAFDASMAGMLYVYFILFTLLLNFT
jgi:non-ribosomal peptide synthetase component F